MCTQKRRRPPHKQFIVGCSPPLTRLADHLTVPRTWYRNVFLRLKPYVCTPSWYCVGAGVARVDDPKTSATYDRDYASTPSLRAPRFPAELCALICVRLRGFHLSWCSEYSRPRSRLRPEYKSGMRRCVLTSLSWWRRQHFYRPERREERRRHHAVAAKAVLVLVPAVAVGEGAWPPICMAPATGID